MHTAARSAGMRVIRPTVPDVGDHVDDGAAIALHPARINFTHKDESAGEIVTHNSLETFWRNRLQRCAVLPAGIVDQAINAPVGGKNRLDRIDHGGLVADIADDGGSPAPIF